ncbi:dihydrolipoyllysine-residue acetyltransferase [Candidatus Pseudomonas adelgestsugas]|uniref:Dihydrolipoamide acetyltransferase component of pyruvate dehydrogenase complex n=1 Tax=Candidatus Pseudomonas adelgestsugas TaxID=1302376 RepID=A0ABX5R7U8_9PSED|nr:dihydrolipoyllysine-residue acetyltransferase [Candidatus Pseudomonas adelgestsugas]QAX81559.1 Dihydrolipoyllysine-residue acetyltransferase component of pyruvate dehydrogenase complex [Candidatus Pseudomonas adelgestsugas]
MSELIRVPNFGNNKGRVIELLVKEGDTIQIDQSILILESNKTNIEIPALKAGLIKNLKVKPGDWLQEGDELLELETVDVVAAPASTAKKPITITNFQDILVPDIGSSNKAKIIELLVTTGDIVEVDQSLITLECDKASMEIPSPATGVVESIAVKLTDEVSAGDFILKLKTQDAVMAPAAKAATLSVTKVHAGPAVRKLARELGVELHSVSPTGPHGRVLKEDVQVYVKAMTQKATKNISANAANGGINIPSIPIAHLSCFGETEETPMTRLMQIGGPSLHRNWLNIPHVTQFDQADITDLKAFCVAQKAAAQQAGVRLTLLPMLIKACAHLLKELPDFNSSLASSGKAIIRKKYVHIGFAVDTQDGLLVPVIRSVDQKSLLKLAAEASALTTKARDKKLTADDMRGACFTVSNLGHISGTGFTPIVNAPEVAILGISKAIIQPIWDGTAFQPKLMLPLSLSYDHRVINGAAAAHFTRRLSELLNDIRTLLL